MQSLYNPEILLDDSTCFSEPYESESVDDIAPNPSPAPTPQAVPPPAPHRPATAGTPASRLEKGMVGNTLNTTSKFLERLLPHEKLPFPVNEDLLRRLSTPIGSIAPIWNELRSCFMFRQPPITIGRAAFCYWLNTIGSAMGLVYGRKRERLWWNGKCEGPPVGPIQDHIILLDRSQYRHATISHTTISHTPKWAFVKALVEEHQSQTYMTFLCQPHRRFTISLSFMKAEDVKFSITITDRAGRIRVNNIDLLAHSTENGLLLLYVLAFLMFGSPEDIGLDPHFEINPLDGQVTAIKCENRRFEVVRRVHALTPLCGRGTQVWVVVHDGVTYILKDFWVHEDSTHNEVAHLRKMKDHKELEGHVPTLIYGGDVVINGVKDSMQRYRSARCTHHVHRRIVTSTVGQPITSFKSKKELIKVIMDIVETHRYLYDHVGILHCDLSIKNILLNRKDDDSEAVGLLIDYGYSIEVHSEDENQQDVQRGADSTPDTRADPPIGEVANAPLDTSEKSVAVEAAQIPTPRSGTPPYMAVEALLNSNFVHKPWHDLESILYIILYICTFVQGPGLPALSPFKAFPIHSWFQKDEIRNIGYIKLAHLECYELAILPNFTPYWRDFTPFVTELIKACFPVIVRSPNELRYEQMLGILKKAYDTVEEPSVQFQVPQAIPQALEQVLAAGAQNLKRPNSSPAPSDRDSKRGKGEVSLNQTS